MLFAMEEINNSTDILPGIILGYKFYDDCFSIARGVRVALASITRDEMAFTPSDTTCTQVQANIVATSSSPGMAISTLLGPFHIPLVGKDLHKLNCHNLIIIRYFFQTVQ